ncbi:MAG: alpha/beta hydrolase [Acidobacteriota bacterium]
MSHPRDLRPPSRLDPLLLLPLLLVPLLLSVACTEAPPAAEPLSQPGERSATEESPEESAPKLALESEPFFFTVAGNRLSGLLDRPLEGDPVATIIIVHGYGETSVVEHNWYLGLRHYFATIGIRTLIWDKPGCGESEGEFDINQPVESSADEVVAAIQALRERGIEGTDKVGLWGISRAGWIAPLAIQKDPSIDFWISVSGTDDKENGRYLLETNFPIEGRTPEETETLVAEWQARFDITWQGGTYEEYLAAGPNLAEDEFMDFMGWGGSASEEGFYAYQAKFLSGELTVDEEEGLQIYVPGFRDLLSSLELPVLALFGDKDTNVDWRKTSQLYEESIGQNPEASLTVKVFPNANHVLRQADTGGVRETNSQPGGTPMVEGYFKTMLDWLVDSGFGERQASG